LKRAAQFGSGLDANIGKLTRDSFASSPTEVAADAQVAARTSGGTAAADRLNSLVEQYGGWDNQRAVSLGVSAAMMSNDRELANAGLGAASAIAHHAGQEAVARGMQTEIDVRNHQHDVSHNSGNSALSSAASSGDPRAAGAAAGIKPGSPAMPAAPGAAGGGFGKANPQAEKGMAEYYNQPEVRNEPSRQREVGAFDSLNKMGVAVGSPEWNGTMNTAKKQDQSEHKHQVDHAKRGVDNLAKR
jgi:hypothetical protein